MNRYKCTSETDTHVHTHVHTYTCVYDKSLKSIFGKIQKKYIIDQFRELVLSCLTKVSMAFATGLGLR